MRLTEITFNRFKSFGDTAQLVQGFRKMNMSYGNNNSGKSNCLKFLGLLFERKAVVDPGLIVENEIVGGRTFLGSFYEGTIQNEPFIFHNNIRTNPIEFQCHFLIGHQEITESGFDKTEELFMEYPSELGDESVLVIKGNISNFGDPFTSSVILLEVKLNGRELFLNDGTTKHHFRSGAATQSMYNDSLIFQNFMNILNNQFYFLDTDRFFVKEVDGQSTAKLTHRNFKNWLHNLSLDAVNRHKYENFINFIKQQPFSTTAFETKPLRYFNPSYAKFGDEIQVLLECNRQKLPLDSFGTGIQQILAILALIFETSSKILLIEEVELNLSPKTQKLFFRILRNVISSGKLDQMFFTTHSPYFNFVTDFSLYEVSISQLGVSSIANSPATRRSFFANPRLD